MIRRSRLNPRTSNADALAGLGFMIFWVLAFILSLGFVGVVIWAIIKLVFWVTAQ